MDGFPQPHTLIYKNEDEFATGCGGCTSLFIMLLIILYSSQQFLFLFYSPQYQETVTHTYSDFSKSDDRVTMDMDKTSLAVSLTALPTASTGTFTADQVNRIQFYQLSTQEDGTSEHLWIPAVRCNEVYAEEIAAGDTFFLTEFSSDEWICPDIASIELWRNPFLYTTGKNLVMVVNECNVAVDVDTANGVTSYSTTACLPQD